MSDQSRTEISELGEFGKVEQMPLMNGRRMHMMMIPLNKKQ